MSTSSQSLQKYAKPVFSAAGQKDSIAPYSYQDWYKSYQGIIPSQEFKQYNEYLVNWYKDRSKSVTDTKLQLKLNYLTLLKQLQVFFTKEESENWYNQVNVEDEKELLLAIPYFAKKLKDISLYYLELRKNIKEARLRYNQVGTDPAITNQIQKLLLSNYTQRPDTAITIPFNIWKNVPQLSAIKDNLTIEIEELYDKQHYFDQSPTVPVSAYYNLTNADLQEFLTTKNLPITSVEWIYRLGTHPLSGDYLETIWNGAISDDTSEIDLAQKLAEKYLGQDKFTSFNPSYSTVQDFYTLEIESGNNFFLWPGVVYRTQAKSLPRYEPVGLQETELTTLGQGGSSIDTADTIFIKSTRGLEGAWLYSKNNEISNVTMNAIIDSSNKTAFRFPFPGYGLSAEGIEWSGPSLKTDPRFFYLDDTFKQSVERAYWSLSLETSTVKPLLINNTTLIENKAHPSKQYQFADKIKVWENAPAFDQVSYTGVSKESWLYRMDSTNISIPANGFSLIYWPYEKIKDPTADFPTYFPENVNNVCNTVLVSSVNFSYAVAGNTIAEGDIIYKINNYRDVIEDATECCWLSGKTNAYSTDNIFTVKQPSFQGHFKAGTYTQFIWQGQDNTDVNNVFQSLNHDPDCKFVTTKNTTYKDHELCTCRQILFTPFGHPGARSSDYRGVTDIIFEDNLQEQNINLTNRPLSSYCWFQTRSKQGWGDGEWVATKNQGNNFFLSNDFYLRTGKTYVYYRANDSFTDSSQVAQNLSDLIIRYNYNTFDSNTYGKDFIWVEAARDSNNNWVSNNKPSRMSLAPGDILVYSRSGTHTHTLTGTITQQDYIAENRGSIWSNFDYITQVENPLDYSLSANLIQKNIFVSYPQQNYFTSISLSKPDFLRQVPLNANRVVRIDRWTVTHFPDNRLINPTTTITITGDSVLSFVPTLTGIYTVTVRAITAATNPPQVTTNLYSTGAPAFTYGTTFYQNTGFYTFTNIPSITAIPSTTTVPSQTAYSTPIPGYVLNTPLKGWDYNRNVASPIVISQNNGAKPYWAKTYVDKSKGIESWGTPKRIVDEHNILTLPEFSDITIQTGSYIEYMRNYGTDLKWNQPLVLAVSSSEQVWNKLEFNIDTSVVTDFNDFTNITNDNLIVIPTLSVSDIILNNFVDNEPVEVLYNASNSFTWNITATPEIKTTYVEPLSTQLAIQAIAPWTNFSNQHYPTVAVFPTFEKLHSQKDVGGYTTPNNLGATLYTNKDYILQLNLTSTNLTKYFENVNKSYKSRGLTLQDQNNPYELIDENNIWLKEPSIAGPIAGTIKKNIFKKYQKFLPYQSQYESNPKQTVGLITPYSRHTPWGGKDNLEWTDYNNTPISPTGELNVDRWTTSQILKKKTQQIDTWVTDIFGNQYGLYKGKLFENNFLQRKALPGELWVRSNNQSVSPAAIALTGVFDTYLNTPLYSVLTGAGINKIDLFFDTLMIETSSSIIFEKINYDFNTNNIFSLIDDTRYISLPLPVRNDFSREFTDTNLTDKQVAKAGETWFFPENKKVIISVCGVEPHTDQFSPTFYWELKSSSTTTTFNLSGTINLPIDSQSYIVTIGGVQQPLETYTINSDNRTITFIQPVLKNTSVFVLLPYNPELIERYDLPPKQITTISPTPKSVFTIPDLSDFDIPYVFNPSQYMVSVGGVLQQPGAAGENTYVILDDNLIKFNETIPSNIPVTVTRLPNYIKCNTSTFYTWSFITTDQQATTFRLDSGPQFISRSNNAYIVNVGGVLQPPTKYTINSNAKLITFTSPIPKDVLISVTQLSVPQIVYLTPELYELDLNTQNLQKVFPLTTQDVSTLKEQDFELLTIDPPVLSFNKLTKEFLLTIFAKNCDNTNVLIDFVITNYLTYDLKNVTYYQQSAVTEVEEPPTLKTPLFAKIRTTPFYKDILNFQCQVLNGRGSFKTIKKPAWINLSEDGRFYGVPPIIGIDAIPEEYTKPLDSETTGIYKIEFSVENSFGPTFYEMVVEVEHITNGPIFEDSFILLENSNDYLIDHDGNKLFLERTEIPFTYNPDLPYINVLGNLVTFDSQQNLPSFSQTYTVNGNNLFAPITAYAPQNFEISFNNQDYTDILILPLFTNTNYVNDTTIYLRVVEGAPLGTEITQLTTVTLKEQPIPFTPPTYLSTTTTIARYVVSPTPVLEVQSDFRAFTASSLSLPPELQIFSVKGANLQGPILLTTSGNFELSLDGNTYKEQLLLQPTIQNIVPTTPVYIRLKNFLSNGEYNNNLIISSLNAFDLIVPINGLVEYSFSNIFANNNLKRFDALANTNSKTQVLPIFGNDILNSLTITAPEKYNLAAGPLNYLSNQGPALTDIPFTNLPTTPVSASYVSFDNQNYNFYVYEGKNIAFLTQDNYFNAPEYERMRAIVSTFDKVYEWYEFYTGSKPTPWGPTLYNNKLTVATGVLTTCGAACGYVGFTGIEVQKTFWDNYYVNNLITLNNNLYDQVIFYEFGRNFWFLDDRFRNYQNPPVGLLFMDGAFAIFMRFITMEKVNVQGSTFVGSVTLPFNIFKNAITGMMTTYINGSYNFNNTFKIDRGVPSAIAPTGNTGASDLMASLLFDLRDRFGDLWLNNIWKKIRLRPQANTIQEAADNFIISCAEAIQLNIIPLFENYYRWPVSPQAKTYIEQFPMYQDLVYTQSLTLSTTNTIDLTNIIIRLTSQAASVGSYNGNLTITGPNTTTQNIFLTGLTT